MHIKFTKFMLLLCSINFGFSQLFIAESFADPTLPPSGWTLNSVGSGNFTFFRFGSVPNQSVAIIENSSIAQNEELITPAIDLSNTTVCYLDFRGIFRKNLFVDFDVAEFIVSISTNNGVTWTPIWDDSLIDYGTNLSNTETINLDLASYTGIGNSQVKIKFNFKSVVHSLNVGQNSFQLFFVNVSSCRTPSISSVVPEVTWTTPTGFSGTYDVEYGPIDFIQGTGTLVTGLTGNSFTNPDFNCNSYDVYVRANCGTTPSPWSFRGRRSQILNIPQLINITSSSTTVNWSGLSGSSYVLEYGPIGFAEGTGTTINNINTSNPGANNTTIFFQEISNLNPCTDYTVRVKSACSTTDTWRFTNFTTATGTTTPLSVPFTEPFNDGLTLCDLGYSQIFNAATITNNELRLPAISADYFLNSRKMALQANQEYAFQIDARTVFSVSFNDPIQLGFIKVKRDGDSSFEQNLFEFSSNSLNDTFSNFSAVFTPMVTDNYYLEFKNLTFTTSLAFKNLAVTENLSIDFNQLTNVSIFPNPATSYLMIQVSNEVFKGIEIFDLTGKKIMVTNQSLINMENLYPGVYLVKIELESGKSIAKKIIKQ
ncbi:MAG: T9SS type A sorting domain-containing protein [Flavobacterium sp.]